MKLKPELLSSFNELPSGKKIYFASDFHLGAPNETESRNRENKIIKWLEHISKDASAIFLLGDVFDFWHEYKTTIPRGFIRFQGKLAQLVDQGIQIFIFCGNHDLWYEDYFPSQIGVSIIKDSAVLNITGKKFYLAHGDGLGTGDYRYKFLKKVFTNPLCKWLFRWVHPDVGVTIAKFWSKKSRDFNQEEIFLGEKERLFQFCKELNKVHHHDYYVFGHRHLPLEMKVDDSATYFNLGEWVTQCNYLTFDGKEATLKTFED